MRESLAGRIFDFYLPPLHFKEYLYFKGKQELITKSKLFADEIKTEMELYVDKQFVEIIPQNKEFIADYTKSIIEKVVYIDIPQVFSIANEGLLLRLLKIIAFNPGGVIEFDNLSRELGVDRNTISNYLFYLEEAFLIRKVYHFSSNRLTSERKLKKYYLNSTSFFSYLNPNIERSKIIENLFAVETRATFFWRTHAKDEVDFVLEENNKLIPLEVKYSETLTSKDMRPLAKFCREFEIKEGFIVTKGEEETRKVLWNGWEAIIHQVSMWKWLLEK